MTGENRASGTMTKIEHLSLQFWKKKESQQGWKILQEIIAEILLYLATDTNLQIQEAEQTPNRIDLKKSVPRHITAKLLKTTDEVLKAAREK